MARGGLAEMPQPLDPQPLEKAGPSPHSAVMPVPAAPAGLASAGPDPADPYLVRPDPHDPRLTERVRGIDHTGAAVETSVTVERALTIFLNAQEIVTAMTIADYPEYLALGYLLNQNMLRPDDVVTGI